MKTEYLNFVVCEETRELFRRSKSNPDLFLKISPWVSGEDRRRRAKYSEE